MRYESEVWRLVEVPNGVVPKVVVAGGLLTPWGGEEADKRIVRDGDERLAEEDER